MRTLLQTLFIGCICVICLGTTLALRGTELNAKKIFEVLFSEKKHFQQPFFEEDPDEDMRGRAQQMQPDIDLPPSAQAHSQGPQPLPYRPQTYENFNGDNFKELISGLENIAHLAKDTLSSSNNINDTLPSQIHRPQNAAEKIKWVAPPPGFMTAETFNYLIYREQQPVTQAIKSVLDNIHGNLMLDLTPFTIIIKPSKILVMLFSGHQSYMDFTKRPAWSGASSNLQADTMYVIEQQGYYPLAVHELTHLYFDGYFLPTISPLWLSEGMAVYMQIYATKQTPDWVKRSLAQILEEGAIIPFEEMTAVEDLKNYSNDQAALWYTQAYSVVNYLLNKRTRDEFYRFCNELKAGTPLHQALYRAYGMPFNKVSALQNVWLHDLQKQYRQAVAAAAPQPQVVAPAPAPIPVAEPEDEDEQEDEQETDTPAPATAAVPVRQQQTKINKLKLVPTNGYKGGF